MKTIEEKAQAYEKAIERAKITLDCCDSASTVTKNTVYGIFPELRESEDEKIKEEIINYFQCQSRDEPSRKTTHKKWIAWLEKQGEQKQDPCEKCDHFTLNCHNFPCIKKKAFDQGKSALEAIKEEKVAWSEEDENKVTLFMQLTEGCDNEEELADWLKSLKERIKPKWKPSEEQMDNLCRAFNGATYQVSLLRKLYQDLKKLKEE